jgi:hypothetical protein
VWAQEQQEGREAGAEASAPPHEEKKPPSGLRILPRAVSSAFFFCSLSAGG